MSPYRSPLLGTFFYIDLNNKTGIATLICQIAHDPEMLNTFRKFDPNVTPGWGNGYVGVPKSHPLYGVRYYKVQDGFDSLDVRPMPLSLSFSGKITESVAEFNGKDLWFFGFDTLNPFEDYSVYTKEVVTVLTLRLEEILTGMTKNGNLP